MPFNTGQLLGHVSLLNVDGDTVYDTFVHYPRPILVTKTDEPYSGIRLSDITPENALPFSKVQETLRELLNGRIIIGHDIQKDITAISMSPGAELNPLTTMRSGTTTSTPKKFEIQTRDTQKYSGFQKYATTSQHGPSLKVLARKVLVREIKTGRVSSVEDAKATLDLYRMFEGWRAG